MSAIATNNAYASEHAADQAGLDDPAVDTKLAEQAAPSSQEQIFAQIQQKYTLEREKRLRQEGNSQFFKLATSDKYKHLAADCWAKKDQTPRLPLHDGMHTKAFILGGGFSGLLYAVRLLQVGFKPKEIVIADIAGGYGGTWYWNRYPGLMCDVESYIYLPLLEETGYMPKHKYSYGTEIREHSNRIAKHWHLEDRGAFQQRVTHLDWQESENCWQIRSTDLVANKPVTLTADFVFVAPGLLLDPKLAAFTGTDEFKGHVFHTARWDYDYTGGSPGDPTMNTLKDKKVGIIGTGATAIQAVPHLARCAKELYVFQRTPSSVDRRDQRPTDPDEFAKDIAARKGWQQERSKNFNLFLNNAQPPPERNLIDDGWTKFPSYSGLLGGPKQVSMDNVGEHVASIHALDIPRQEYIRKRAADIVKDKETAEKLKPWYPGWCKRPCFHDEYLQAFNLPNVHLVDTDGKGVDGLCEKGIVANGQEYDLDCVIFGTGYDLEGRMSPTKRANVHTHGRNGRSLDEKWAGDIATIHGVVSRDFPNMFFSGPNQATASANFTVCLDLLAQHAAYIISQGRKNTRSDKVIIEPSVEGEEEWTMRVLGGAFTYAALAGCTPSYLNGEGDADRIPQEQQMKQARASTWGQGLNDFMRVLEEWREDGKLKGLEVTPVGEGGKAMP